LAITASAVVASVGPALAQDATGLHVADDDAVAVQPLGVTVGDLDDLDVHGANGEELGEVEAVLADGAGKVIGIVADVGGLLGMGERDIVIGLDQLTKDGDRLKVNMTKEQIEAVPEFDIDD
jgi:PRC-barrel domain